MHTAGYSCPRCLIAYCSSKCYKAHGSACTEAFFRSHVEREMKLRDAEDHRHYPPEEAHRGSRTSSASPPPLSSAAGAGGVVPGVGTAKQRREQMVQVLHRLRRSPNDTQNRRRGMNTLSRRSSPLSSFSSSGGDCSRSRSPAAKDSRVALSEDGAGSPAEIQGGTINAGALDAGVDERDDGRGGRGGAISAGLSDDRLEELGKALGAFGLFGGGDSDDGDGNGDGDSASTKRNGGLQVVEEAEEERVALERAARIVSGDDDSSVSESVAERNSGGSNRNTVNNGPLNLLTEEESARFLREVASGALGKLIVPWVPWWVHTAGIQEVLNTSRSSVSTDPPTPDFDDDAQENGEERRRQRRQQRKQQQQQRQQFVRPSPFPAVEQSSARLTGDHQQIPKSVASATNAVDVFAQDSGDDTPIAEATPAANYCHRHTLSALSAAVQRHAVGGATVPHPTSPRRGRSLRLCPCHAPVQRLLVR
ncbi:unnamed protein product [Sphacelaria rigidula]